MHCSCEALMAWAFARVECLCRASVYVSAGTLSTGKWICVCACICSRCKLCVPVPCACACVHVRMRTSTVLSLLSLQVPRGLRRKPHLQCWDPAQMVIPQHWRIRWCVTYSRFRNLLHQILEHATSSLLFRSCHCNETKVWTCHEVTSTANLISCTLGELSHPSSEQGPDHSELKKLIRHGKEGKTLSTWIHKAHS